MLYLCVARVSVLQPLFAPVPDITAGVHFYPILSDLSGADDE
jgi:hypothetical protein